MQLDKKSLSIGPTCDRFELANRVFADALELASSERHSFVDRACSDDPRLKDSVLRLLSRFEQLGDFLENPAQGVAAAPRTELKPGDVLAARFRILGFIGRGGMGEVYRAEDLVLGDPVALKIVRAQWRGDTEALTRFRDEVRMARRVSHPNVCRTFEVFSASFEHEDLAFFTMELLEGPSLAEILASGPLEVGRILRIASGIASGLDAAHQAGIVHGDLKPGNIILAADPQNIERAVITDFGLASLHGNGPSGGSGGSVVAGSPDYMAPEQFLGEGITPAADIFALAVIVYEMLSGQRPYPNESFLRIVIRRTTQDAPSILAVAPRTPKPWDAALAKAMSRSIEERPRTAGEFLLQLTASQERPFLIASPVGRRAVLAILAGGAGVAAFFRLRRLPDVALHIAPVIMLTPLTSSSPHDAAAMELAVQKGLAQSPHLRVLEQSQVAAAWKRMGRGSPLPSLLDGRTAREIALRVGAQLVLFGSFDRVSDEWRLNLSLEVMGGNPTRPGSKYAWSSTEHDGDSLLGKAGRAVTWIRQQAGESASILQEHNVSPEALTTKSWPALLEFTSAEEAWRAQPSDAAWPPDRRAAAELHLRRSLELDPQFALAFARLADIQVASNEIDAGLLNYQKAARILDGADLTDRESLRIRGLFALDTGQYGKAGDVFAMWGLKYPKDALALFYRAGCVNRLGNPAAALQLLDRAIDYDPNRYSFIMGRAIHLLAAGRFEEARRDCDRAAKLDGTDWTELVRSALAFAAFDAEAVLACIERLKQSGSIPYRSKAFGFEACLRTEWGQFDRAEALLQEGLIFDNKNLQPAEALHTKNRLLAQFYLLLNRQADAIACCERILAARPGVRISLETGAILARANDLAGARRCIPAGLPKNPPDRPPASLPDRAAPELLEWPLYWRRVLLLWGEIALQQGNAGQAFRLIAAAPQSDTPQEWPAALVRASLASGENTQARRCIDALLQNPAAYWIAAETTGPGFLRFALDAAPQRNSASKALQLKSFLNHTH
jgi:serine/threonine protein kinase/tetratricopeptide (TPR) repeat protein